MKKKKGFTLVELLAVIAVLAIILVIAVPKIMNVIEDAREGTLLATAKIIAREAEKKLEEYKIKGIEDNVYCEDIGHISNSEYQSCDIRFDDNGVAKVTIKGKGKYAGMNVCNATRYNGEVTDICYTDSACFAYEDVSRIRDFSINKTACETFFIADGAPVEDAEVLCSGGTLDGYNFREAIEAAIADGSSGAMGFVNLLIDEGVIIVVYSDGIEITGYDIWCGGQDVLVPSKIEGTEVIGIGENAFCDWCGGDVYDDKNKENKFLLLSNKLYDSRVVPLASRYVVKSIYLPNTIQYIDAWAIADNELTSIDLSELSKLKSIGNGAFSSNHLTSVKLPSSIVEISDEAFAYNYSSMNVNFTDLINLEYIGWHAFAYSEILGSLDLRGLSNLKIIESEAFYDSQIETLILPSSLEYVGSFAFYGYAYDSTNQTYYNYPKNVTVNNDGDIYDNCAFGYLENLTSHNLPETYTCNMK